MTLLPLLGCISKGVTYTATILDVLCLHILSIMIPDSFARPLRKLPRETCNSEAGETWREMAMKFAYEVSLSYL
jgi:hypothetical protein